MKCLERQRTLLLRRTHSLRDEQEEAKYAHMYTHTEQYPLFAPEKTFQYFKLLV